MALPIICLEEDANQDPAIGLHRDRIDPVLGSEKDVVKARVQTAIGIEPRDSVMGGRIPSHQAAPNNNLAVTLQGQRKNRREREESTLKPVIQGAICIEPRNAIPLPTIDRVEPSPNEHLGIALHCYRSNPPDAARK